MRMSMLTAQTDAVAPWPYRRLPRQDRAGHDDPLDGKRMVRRLSHHRLFESAECSDREQENFLYHAGLRRRTVDVPGQPATCRALVCVRSSGRGEHVRLGNVIGWLRKNIASRIRSLLRRFRKHIVVPGWRAVKDLGLLCIFLLLAVAAVVGALLLQRVAFPAAGSSGDQISATVYVEKLPAQVNLQSTFTPECSHE
jgi:hypothetical protein